MTIGQLRKAIETLPDSLDITVRCEYDGYVPEGNCFALRSVSVEDDHTTEKDFVAFDCDQEQS